MRIANPIYDVVFKDLLDDEKVARLLLSALLGREVVSLKAQYAKPENVIPDTRSGDSHFLDILEEDYPERYREVLRRLTRAHSEKKVRDGMDVEDDYLATLLDKERSLAEKDRIIEKKDLALEEKNKEIEARNREIEARNREIETLKKRLGTT